MAKTSKNHAPLYRSYRFMDKDPIIDRVRTAFQDSGNSYRDIEDLGGPRAGTLSRWFTGGTRRPQFCTVMAALHACGVDLKETPYSLRKNGRK